MIKTTERMNSDFIIYLNFIFIIFLRMALVKIRALYVTVRMSTGGVARWQCGPSIDYSPRYFFWIYEFFLFHIYLLGI